jgi:ABC-2 type transport system ATP-binding protein
MDTYALVLDSVSKEYSSKLVLDKVSFKVRKGTVHGLLGPNGAGKTTTMNIIAKLISCSSGHIQYCPSIQSIGFLSETAPLYNDLTVVEYLTYVAEIYSLKKMDRTKLDEILNLCGLNEVKSKIISILSKGFKQRVGIAQALVYRPDLIILDEPTLALDPESIQEIRKLILDLKKKHTIILSTHILSDVDLLCDDMTVLKNGKLIATGLIDDIKSTLQLKRKIRMVFQRCPLPIDLFFKNYKISSPFDIDEGALEMTVKFEVDDSMGVRQSLIKLCSDNSLPLLEINSEELNTEDIFDKLMAKDLH